MAPVPAGHDRRVLSSTLVSRSSTNYRAYAGIGSRKTPDAVLRQMERVGAKLAGDGWTLRSGGADGADSAFARGAAAVQGAAEIYLPWSRFGDCASGIDASALPSFAQAQEIAARHHPAWAKLGRGVRALMARNAMQVLGANLDSPSRFILCWADGSVFDGDRIVDCAGGTGLAVRLGVEQGIAVFNLAVPAHAKRLDAWLAGPAS